VTKPKEERSEVKKTLDAVDMTTGEKHLLTNANMASPANGVG
jgi:hypothetical protein